MITGKVHGNIFNAPNKHIAFAVNVEGHNDSGFAGTISDNYWPELANTGGNELGEVLRKETPKRIFHALVCHSLGRDGWEKTPETVTKCLDSLDVPENEEVAIVLMGSGFVGQMQGANVAAIECGIHEAKRKVVIYYL